RDWSSDVCSSDLPALAGAGRLVPRFRGLAEAPLACVLAQAHAATPSRTLARARLLRRLLRGLGLLRGLLHRHLLLRRRTLVAVDALLQQRHEVDHVGGGALLD